MKYSTYRQVIYYDEPYMYSLVLGDKYTTQEFDYAVKVANKRSKNTVDAWEAADEDGIVWDSLWVYNN